MAAALGVSAPPCPADDRRTRAGRGDPVSDGTGGSDPVSSDLVSSDLVSSDPVSSILIAEDEPRLSAVLERGLQASGFTTATAADGPGALQRAQSRQHDLMILDLGLPGLDGFTVLRRIREAHNDLPVIVLSGRCTLRDRVAALEGGADDFVGKPFAFDELVARVRLRIHGGGGVEPTMLTVGSLTLDLRRRHALVAGRCVELTSREFFLTEVFCRCPDQVLTRRQLLAQVWGVSHDIGSNVVDVYVRYLRGKLGADRFETVRGVGYRLLSCV